MYVIHGARGFSGTVVCFVSFACITTLALSNSCPPWKGLRSFVPKMFVCRMNISHIKLIHPLENTGICVEEMLKQILTSPKSSGKSIAKKKPIGYLQRGVNQSRERGGPVGGGHIDLECFVAHNHWIRCLHFLFWGNWCYHNKPADHSTWHTGWRTLRIVKNTSQTTFCILCHQLKLSSLSSWKESLGWNNSLFSVMSAK